MKQEKQILLDLISNQITNEFFVYFPDETHAWDLSAACLILRNAGGYVTDLEGNDIDAISHKGFIIASANQNAKIDFLKMVNSLFHNNSNNLRGNS